ncbi:MAG: putative MFS family arabinose efflux permease [Gammaproteobacteria bacterium]|jgi:predicted MFS family arabinose efflux permease
MTLESNNNNNKPLSNGESVSIWGNKGFRSYIQTTGFSGMAFSMHQLLISWLFIGVLQLSADDVGLLQALMGFPGIFLMLWGGASADSTDPRQLLIRVYAIAPLLPLFLIIVHHTAGVALWSVVLWGFGMSLVISFSQPSQQAILNQVSGSQIQKGVSAATAIGFLVQITGLLLAGQIDTLGLTVILVAQGTCFGMGVYTVFHIRTRTVQPASQSGSTIEAISEGLKVIYRHKDIFHVLSINFVSSIFNAGAFITVFPFIIKRIYDGDAMLLATMMAIFYAGATASNLLMYKLMPFARPGRLFLIMQLTRMIILFLLWTKPDWWLLVAVIFAWGVNMGFTTTLARTIVQESAAPQFRGRVMSVFTLGMMGSAPLGAIVLGAIIEWFGTLNALLPAIVLSIVLFIAGITFTGLWTYQSPLVSREQR